MTQIIKPEKKTPEIADILHHHMDDYKAEYPLWPEHRKIVSDLLNCRTAHSWRPYRTLRHLWCGSHYVSFLP